MTAPTTAKKKATPQENREKKARLIARAAWRRGLTYEQLAAMPYSGEERSRTRFARMAYRESPDPADRDVNPPSGPESRTWRLVEDKLKQMAGRARRGESCPERDLLAERQAWLSDDADPWKEEAGWSTPGSQDTSSGSSSEPPASGPSANPPPTADAPDAGTPTTAPSGFPAQRSSPPSPNDSPSLTPSVPPAEPSSPSPADAPPTLPRGWGELAALPPLTYDWCIHHPDRRPVVISPDGPRCASCPPRPGEFEFGRSGWGIRLNWAPRHCNGPIVRCYCGRCPSY